LLLLYPNLCKQYHPATCAPLFLSSSFFYHHTFCVPVSVLHYHVPELIPVRRKNITSTIYRKTDVPVTISRHISSTVGNHSFKSRISARPSSAHISASTSASPAPSSISACSHEIEPDNIQWDLPTRASEVHPTTRNQKHTTVCCPKRLFTHDLLS
jgi:hypothetical protein